LNSQPIASVARTGNEVVSEKFVETLHPVNRQITNGVRGTKGITEVINYGFSAPQITIHEGNFLHEKGFTGKNMVIALLDAGYSDYDINNALDSTRNAGRILGGYDFVTNTNTISETNAHGMYCLSIMASNKPGQIVGSSPHAKFYLLRTENAAEEYPVEEFFWALGAEYADSAGVDIISSSLGYTSFDNPVFNNEYIDRDGNTCLSTIAADIAAAKGIIVCNSAGNSGGFSTEEKYVAAPADGDSVLAVGAVKPDKTIAGFSSWGPNSAGKIKPDVVSIGQGTILALANGTPSGGNGTSFSNPNIAGLVACLWEAFPEFTNMEIIRVVKESSDRYTFPDERYGYGIPNFRIAYNKLDSIRLQRNADNILKNDWIKIVPNPYNSNVSLVVKANVNGYAKIRIFDIKGSLIEESTQPVSNGITRVIPLSGALRLAKGIYIVRYDDGQRNATLRIVHQ
jgi:serine protease AprX